jgi:Holliday junction resolvase RusA-like endonuclease
VTAPQAIPTPPGRVSYQNPYYHFLFGFFGVDVPSKRTRLELNHANKTATFWQAESGQQFEALIRKKIAPDNAWPLKGRVLLAIDITLSPESFKTKDIDNVSKSILDALKGLVYDDDRQVVSLFVSKSVGECSSFFVGVRELAADETSWYMPSLYSDSPYPGQSRAMAHEARAAEQGLDHEAGIGSFAASDVRRAGNPNSHDKERDRFFMSDTGQPLETLTVDEALRLMEELGAQLTTQQLLAIMERLGPTIPVSAALRFAHELDKRVTYRGLNAVEVKALKKLTADDWRSLIASYEEWRKMLTLPSLGAQAALLAGAGIGYGLLEGWLQTLAGGLAAIVAATTLIHLQREPVHRVRMA